jgi:hypothetical protein
MTPSELQAIRERAESATPGPWRVRPDEYDDWGVVKAFLPEDGTIYVARAGAGRYVPSHEISQHRLKGTDPYQHNADFIAHARADIPALLAEIERLQGIVDYLTSRQPDTLADREVKDA